MSPDKICTEKFVLEKFSVSVCWCLIYQKVVRINFAELEKNPKMNTTKVTPLRCTREIEMSEIL